MPNFKLLLQILAIFEFLQSVHNIDITKHKTEIYNPTYNYLTKTAVLEDEFNYIRDVDSWCRRILPNLPKVPRLMCNSFPRSTVLMVYEGTQLGVDSCQETFWVSYWFPGL